MELYGSIMHRVAFKILKNEVDSEEVVQETLLKLFKNGTVPALDDEAIAAKLSAAVKNMALDFYAKLSRQQTIHYDDGLNSDNPGMCEPSADDSVNEKIDLQHCIERLPRLQREYIQLRYHQDLSIKEIAQLKGKSEKSVYATLERAIARLRKLMNE